MAAQVHREYLARRTNERRDLQGEIAGARTKVDDVLSGMEIESLDYCLRTLPTIAIALHTIEDPDGSDRLFDNEREHAADQQQQEMARSQFHGSSEYCHGDAVIATSRNGVIAPSRLRGRDLRSQAFDRLLPTTAVQVVLGAASAAVTAHRVVDVRPRFNGLDPDLV